MNRTIEDLPEYFEVKIGRSEFELSTDSLITSMAHQFISKSGSHEDMESYDLLFEVTKNELIEYLYSKKESKELFIDLFSDWVVEFKDFHSKRNEPFCRDVVFSFKDGSKWSIKVLDLMATRTPEDSSSPIDFSDPILKNDKKFLRWVNSLTWDEIKHLADELQRPQPEPDYESEWKQSKKEIVKWENDLSLLDFYELDDNIRFEENLDDRSIPDN
jgi:hypothetical protein